MPDTASSMAPGGSSAPAGQPPQAAETVPGTAPAPNTRRWWFIAACIGLALAARGLLLLHAPDHAFLSDHIEFMAWANWVAERGPTALYDVTAEYLINVRFPPEGGRPPRVAPYPAIDRCNYPPLAGDLLWLQGKLWRWLDPQVQTLQVGPDLARYAEFRGRAATSPVANTLAARGANAAAPIVADFLTAWGVLRLVRALRRQDHDAEPRGTRAENVAFAVALLAPLGFAEFRLLDANRRVRDGAVDLVCLSADRAPLGAGRRVLRPRATDQGTGHPAVARARVHRAGAPPAGGREVD